MMSTLAAASRDFAPVKIYPNPHLIPCLATDAQVAEDSLQRAGSRASLQPGAASCPPPPANPLQAARDLAARLADDTGLEVARWASSLWQALAGAAARVYVFHLRLCTRSERPPSLTKVRVPAQRSVQGACRVCSTGGVAQRACLALQTHLKTPHHRPLKQPLNLDAAPSHR